MSSIFGQFLTKKEYMYKLNVRLNRIMSNPSLPTAFDPMYAALQELALTENEQRLYILSLKQGPTPITKLAELLGLPRPNLYKIIEGLASKGLVDPEARSRYAKNFSVLPPQVISELLKLKHTEQVSINRAFIEQLPLYMSQFRQGDTPLKVKTLVGQKAFQDLYTQMYEEEQEAVRFCGSIKRFIAVFGQSLFERSVALRQSRKVRGIALLLPSDRTHLSLEQHHTMQRDVRYLDGYDEFTPMFHLFSNKLIFWQPSVPMAVLIEDVYLVRMMKSLYEGMWRQASKN